MAKTTKKDDEPEINTDPREYILFLVSTFKVDRYFYLVTTMASLALLFYGFFVLMEDKGSIKTALALLAPTGLITGATYRLLKFWNDCFKLISNFLKGKHQ